MRVETEYECVCGFKFFHRETAIEHAQFIHFVPAALAGEYKNNLAALEDFIEEMIQPSPLGIFSL